MKYILAIICLIFALVIFIYTTIMQFQKTKEAKEKIKTVENKLDTVLKETKENEKRKNTLHTGNSNTDFNNSIELLQKYNSRKSKT